MGEVKAGWPRVSLRVEVCAAGPPDKLSDLAAALRKGPRFSDVRGVDEQEAAPQHYSDFQIEV